MHPAAACTHRRTLFGPPSLLYVCSAIAQGSSEFNITALIDAKNSGALPCPFACCSVLPS